MFTTNFLALESRVHITVTSESDLCDGVWALEGSSNGKIAARIVRGVKCQTPQTLFDEVAAALQFPYYFGENWAALDECLADMEWIQAEVCVIFVSRASLLLHNGRPQEVDSFLQLLARVATQFGREQTSGIDSHLKGLHIVFHTTSSEKHDLLNKLTHAQVVWTELEPS